MINCFSDDAIFEEEDIYNQALPPPANTSSGLTMPGTKWCGPGNTAKNYDDLGSQKEVDKCCRDHDHCPDIIEHHKTLHGLYNGDLFPRLSCNCEQKFLNCLQTIDSTVSTYLGRLYFGLRSNCFTEDYPIIQCSKYVTITEIGDTTLPEQRCVRYKLDKKKSKVWQYFDNPFFTRKT
ncbi:phospholipase A2 [Condylostylus longicornis]|uniref:phospholipase A2 n=1 Tax=Condylostylus longicornis TaxID=2530218 RepID=UPI00244DC70F|nr:phospholipase A2 [Condylostylus longicornis]